MLQMGMWDERSLLPFVETTYHRRRRVLKSKNKKKIYLLNSLDMSGTVVRLSVSMMSKSLSKPMKSTLLLFLLHKKIEK